MARNLEAAVRQDPDYMTLLFELFTLARRHDDIAAEYAALLQHSRRQVAGMLASAQREGVIQPHADPEVIAEILFSIADGLALRMLSEPDRDFSATLDAGIACARALLAD
jgi:AcrR family transcriptional regulator